MENSLRALAKRDLASVAKNQEKRRQWDGKLLAQGQAKKTIARKRKMKSKVANNKKKMFKKSVGK
jgi:hypothetical protein